MPRAFTASERATIRARFRVRGRALFETHGLRKTSIHQLTRAAGVSKGAFYLFFDSKEELFLEILEELEHDFRTRIFSFAASQSGHARALVGKLLKNALLSWDEYPLLRSFGVEDYAYLARKLPAKRIRAHVQRDDEFVRDFIARLKEEGLKLRAAPRVISDLMKCLFFVSLHRDELGSGAYVDAMTVMADLVAEYMIEGKV